MVWDRSPGGFGVPGDAGEDGRRAEDGGTATFRRGPDAEDARPWGRGRPSGGGESEDMMSTPLYQLKAEFFKTLGHPARIRVLELLSEREHAVAEMLPEVGIEPAHLSQQLAVLRRANLVVSRKEGSTVYYSLTSPKVAELLRVARSILSGLLAEQQELLAALRAGTPRGDRRA
ncbi:ArsR family transcriptional regulator [Streptomyces griseoaurantiacus]|uniref:ArsR family transcriptional regulator n=2 Tax=Streptomyces griseoaurantiacus TaxID=68213 RepID=A0A1G7G848_9ACTN|nr:ArsR family transcriptional regulator [Streptomyces jietaisiensis]